MILVLSGTEEGKEIVRSLYKEGFSLLTTVATEYGKKVFEQMGLETVCLQGRLDANGFAQLIKEREIDTVVDATHPYAVQVSQNAIDACKKTNTRYLRFERQKREISDHPLIHKIKTIEDAVDKGRSLGKNIFLTTGVSSVDKFIRLKGEKEVYVRILPIPEHIAFCLDSGVPPMNIIAMHGPFSEDLNRAMFRQYKINTMVTKDSGDAGGVLEKIHAALSEGIDTIVIERPKIEFPKVYSSVHEVINSVKIRERC
ncbi:MAG: precorrin-6A reductase [Candidatus Jettenia sp.]|uniref:Precorrin-6X reductase n=1 Tax=Candidatus Jettenia caeni TaxID=247490 RepID=I3IMA9_9BACT|nr:precorrin-6A reductase [Candidatus Jettenia sp. AMX1]MBC6927734.1 precorrin-6A reductase [Candidatus Jettenia sp.]NUN21927.1 precorrin-6A reductase [Candidatus Jettenia caeni]KAA0251419.1 MAG: precorrin-6A reductase [Candidatus Jettenia sp. AMX1]MCE7879400.1 precorrin-6A reductase [Candidatus Jettenia sp. AMX1]MDL1938349.1 precorrin-6A reductase [Candidatus Jettenia sp. AMX1]